MSQPKIMSNPSPSTSKYRQLGDAFNYLSLLWNVVLTTFAAVQFTSSSTSSSSSSSLLSIKLDPWWSSHGFCVDHNPNRVIDTETIISVGLVASSVTVYYWMYGNDGARRYNDKLLQQDKQLENRIVSGIFANASHGFGHLFLLALGGPTPTMELTWTFEAVGYWIVLLCFWTGVLKTLMPVSVTTYAKAAAMSLAVLAVQYILDVPPELSFTYSQSVILFAGSLDQLAFPRKDFTYMIISGSNLPLFVFYAVEMTACESLAVPYVGGHALYDLYLAFSPFLLYAIVQWHNESNTTSIKAKKL